MEETKNGEQPSEATIWDDPSVPVGNAPPMNRWPMFVAGACWLAGVLFLVMMATAKLGVEGS
jgi:hypothetical protein